MTKSYADVASKQSVKNVLLAPSIPNTSAFSDKYKVVKPKKQVQHEKKAEDERLIQNGGDNTVHSSKRYITGNRSASTSCQHNLTTVGRKVFLFVSRLSPSTTSSEVSDYLKSFYENENFSIEKLKARYPDKYSSFKEGLSTSLLRDVYKPDFWPRDVFVSRFVIKRQNQVEDKSTGLDETARKPSEANQEGTVF